MAETGTLDRAAENGPSEATGAGPLAGRSDAKPHPAWMAEAGLTEAERDEVELCLDFDEYYGHGRPGRFHMIIIAKLARHIREGCG
jgi:hypothetical protein